MTTGPDAQHLSDPSSIGVVIVLVIVIVSVRKACVLLRATRGFDTRCMTDLCCRRR